jgi:ornithine carbamoyltransferase
MTTEKPPRHFLSLLDISPDEAAHLLNRGLEMKRQPHSSSHQPLSGKTLAMLFEKASTRTRVSFEVGMAQLGGHALFLAPRDMQLGRGEPLEDSARVLSSMVDAIMVRTHEHERISTFSLFASVPVINGLTNAYHPCQLLADIQTFYEHRGDIAGRRVGFIGDGNNVCNSYINAAALYGFHLTIACPPGFEPSLRPNSSDRHSVQITSDPREAARGADLIVTDVWASMGQESEQASRVKTFAGYQVDEKLLSLAAPDAIFMHCLPAHRGEEVTAAVIDGPQSVVWDQAANRLHAQKALLEFLIG